MVEYTDVANTGIAWLPQIPQHWEVRKLKYAFNERSEKGYPDEPLLVSSQNMGVVPKSVYGKRTVEALKDLDKLKLVKAGDYVVSLRSFQGGIEYAYYQGIISPAYTIMEPHKDFKSDYYKFLFKSAPFIKLLTTCVTGIREGQNVDYKKLRNVEIPVPPRAEQDQIVRFLDWKVSEINKLIGIRRQEISLIRQYRELRITERLKGKKVWLKRLLKSPLQYGANSSGTDFSSDLPRYIRITDIDSDGNLKQDGAKSIFEEDAAPYILEDGDILLARSGATVGKAFLYKKCYGLSAYAGYLIRAKFDNSRILPEYFMYFTNSSTYLDWKNSVFIQATIQNISAEKYGYLPIPLPSIDEQKRIVNELDLICKYMDSLVEIKYKEIHALQELKAVIISDVVTGKIDVRNVTIPEYEHVDDISDDDNEDGEEREETETDGEEA